MEEMHRAQYGESAQRFHALSRLTTLPNLHVLINLEALQTPSFWVHMEASLHGHD